MQCEIAVWECLWRVAAEGKDFDRRGMYVCVWVCVPALLPSCLNGASVRVCVCVCVQG